MTYLGKPLSSHFKIQYISSWFSSEILAHVSMVGGKTIRMTPVEALRSATSASAECLGIGNESLGPVWATSCHFNMPRWHLLRLFGNWYNHV